MSKIIGVHISGVPVGVIKDYIGGTLPAKFLFTDGKTIGNASSSATARANADTQALFVHLWNNMANAQAPVSGGRGVSAVADFSANKTITLPDARGRSLVGKDDMGGTAASRMTVGGSGVDGVTLGAAGGEQSHLLTGSESGTSAHAHGSNIVGNNTGGYSTNVMASAGTNSASWSTPNSAEVNASSPHNNTQPSLVCNKMIAFA